MFTFNDFIKNKKDLSIIKETFNQSKIDNVSKKIENILRKHIKGAKIIPLVGHQITKSNEETYLSRQYIVSYDKGKYTMFQINWLNENSNIYVYSIDFFDNLNYLFDYKGKSILSLYTLGSSIIYFLPIIWTIINSGDYQMSEREAIELGRKVFKNDNSVKESYFYVGAYRYRIFEDEELTRFARKKRNDRLDAFTKRHQSQEDEDRFLKLNDEYNEIKNAIYGGATSLPELKLAIKKNVNLIAEINSELKSFEEKFNNDREDPERVFKKMLGYIKMVINGINPSLIICGAPGVGKTFRVKKQLKESGYEEGKNLFTIKGKFSVRRLYLALYEYRNKGDILLIDDADAIVGPNAPEDCINILKAALDSTSDEEGRLISYGVASKITNDDGEEIPKRFYYKGGVIVITNWNAGKLDTALRGRSYIQDINFTTEENLQIIQQLMPKLFEGEISDKSKNKAYAYLTELMKEGSDMEISIRTFGICAKIFESCLEDDYFSDEDAKSMIKEQMKLQSSRITGKGNSGKY